MQAYYLIRYCCILLLLPASPHLLIFSHPHILIFSHPHVLTSSSPPILISSHPHIFMSSSSHILISSHLHILTSSFPHTLISSSPDILIFSHSHILTSLSPLILTLPLFSLTSNGPQNINKKTPDNKLENLERNMAVSEDNSDGEYLILFDHNVRVYSKFKQRIEANSLYQPFLN